MNDYRLTQISMSLLIVLHLLPTVQHGMDHSALEVSLPALKWGFVYTVVVATPLVTLPFLWSRWMIAALWAVTIAFAAGTVFGVYHHYILVSPDNIFHLPSGPHDLQASFVNSAGWVALSEGFTAAVGLLWCGYWTGATLAARRNQTTVLDSTNKGFA